MLNPQTTLADPDYRDITQPFNGAVVMCNFWWLCKKGDPRRAAFYEKVYPQCHRDRVIVSSNDFPKKENLIPVFVRTAYCPRRPE